SAEPSGWRPCGPTPPGSLPPVSTYDRLAELPVEIASYSLEGFEQQYTPEFTRMTTVIHMEGGGQEGLGEDVVYDGLDHVSLQAAGPCVHLAGSHLSGAPDD